jgi:hypothetical protein
MTHHLKLELSDDVHRPLAQQAAAAGQTVEAAARDCLAYALQRPAGYGRLRKWAGAFSSAVTDAGQRHDDHIGDALVEELRGRPGA